MVATPIIRLADAAIRPGDALVHCTPDAWGQPVSSTVAKRIADIGRGQAFHCSLADRLGDDALVVVEMYFPEGRQHDLASWVEESPGVIHWLRVPEAVAVDYHSSGQPTVRCYDRLAAVRKMREYIGVSYGTNTIWRDWLSSTPWGRLTHDLPGDDEIVDWDPVCSTAVLDALQVGFGGWDLVKHLHTACAQPEDVYRLCILEDQGALVV